MQHQREIYRVGAAHCISLISDVILVELVKAIVHKHVCDALPFVVKALDPKLHAGLKALVNAVFKTKQLRHHGVFDHILDVLYVIRLPGVQYVCDVYLLAFFLRCHFNGCAKVAFVVELRL